MHPNRQAQEDRVEPLQQWICDTCGQQIASPEEGWLEWLWDEERRAGDFRICHAAAYSPLQTDPDNGPFCQKHQYSEHVGDLDLKAFTGPEGLVRMLALIHRGKRHQPDDAPRVRDFEGWADTCRRLFVPYYEEARLHWDAAASDDYFAGANELWIYRPETLKALIEKYADGRRA